MDTLSSHSSYLLQQLQEQRIQGLLCDCMLVVKGVCFKAHKNVLAAFSSYFRSLFQNSPSQKNDVFNLVIQDVSGIGQILDYMYTSHLDVNQDNVQAFLDIALCLQVPNVQSMCNAFLKPCPPETPSFSLPGVLNDCLLDVDLHCPPAESQRPGIGGDFDHAKRPPVPVSQVATVGTQAPAEKQLVHGYKLRNFYSKQYFKQSAELTNSAALNQGPSPLMVVVEEQYQLGVHQPGGHAPPACTGAATQPNPPFTSAPVEKNFCSSLPPEDPLTTPSSDQAEDSMLNMLMRPKKAVYLKKYNYLRSQKALEEMYTGPIGGPILSGPILSEPIVSRPILSEPIVSRPILSEPIVSGPILSGPILSEPIVSGPILSGPILSEPIVSGPILSGPILSEPIVSGPILSGPILSEPIVSGPILTRLILSEPIVSGPILTGPILSEPIDSCPKESCQEEPMEHNEAPDAPVHCLAGGQEESPETVLDTQLPSPTPGDQEEHEPKTSDPPQPTGLKYSCDMCAKDFKHPSNLELHKRSHTGEKPFQCNICGKNFSQAGNLQTHLRRHSGEKPYICDICGRSFAAAGDVQRHIVVHTRVRPHLCDICGRGFTNVFNLNEHKKTHTTDKPFSCDQCGKSFNTHRKLRKHQGRHAGEKPHRCDTCGRCFIGSGDLQRHVRSHTGERPYLCHACGKSFTRSSLLKRHSSQNCKGAPDASADADGSDRPRTNPDGATAFPKPIGHGKAPEASGEQSYLSVVPHVGLQKPSPPPPPPPPPALSHVDSPSSGMHLGPVSSSTSLPELRSLVPHHLLSSGHQGPGHQGPDHLKLAKPHLPQEVVYGPYVESDAVGMGVEMGGGPAGRPYLFPPTENYCGSNRSNSGSYRANEGPFFSSVALWGLAMKTLQNDNDMEQ